MQVPNLTKIRDVFHTSGYLDETNWIKKEIEIRLSVSNQKSKMEGLMTVFTMESYNDDAARRMTANNNLKRLEQRGILVSRTRVAGKRPDVSGKKGSHTSVENIQIKKY